MWPGKLLKVASVVAALVLALTGVVSFIAAGSGAFGQDKNFAIVAGLGFSLLAAPLFAFPFSKRIFRALGVVVLLALAASLIYSSFQPALAASRPAVYQLGAIAFAVLLVARVVLSVRGRRSRHGV